MRYVIISISIITLLISGLGASQDDALSSLHALRKHVTDFLDNSTQDSKVQRGVVDQLDGLAILLESPRIERTEFHVGVLYEIQNERFPESIRYHALELKQIIEASREARIKVANQVYMEKIRGVTQMLLKSKSSNDLDKVLQDLAGIKKEARYVFLNQKDFTWAKVQDDLHKLTRLLRKVESTENYDYLSILREKLRASILSASANIEPIMEKASFLEGLATPMETYLKKLAQSDPNVQFREMLLQIKSLEDLRNSITTFYPVVRQNLVSQFYSAWNVLLEYQELANELEKGQVDYREVPQHYSYGDSDIYKVMIKLRADMIALQFKTLLPDYDIVEVDGDKAWRYAYIDQLKSLCGKEQWSAAYHLMSFASILLRAERFSAEDFLQLRYLNSAKNFEYVGSVSSAVAHYLIAKSLASTHVEFIDQRLAELKMRFPQEYEQGSAERENTPLAQVEQDHSTDHLTMLLRVNRDLLLLRTNRVVQIQKLPSPTSLEELLNSGSEKK